ncbi:hypothetical protein B0H16DRAFT_1368759 [Mycena metata]|uniref:F-box domain-containing protein n=1 Tax=Mycena metata TaxID=1033252 RepID=A0AAD7JDF2_9AGAR|nr:hypothetical protein B0H16DRAFT_1368759 [Mycena metata]
MASPFASRLGTNYCPSDEEIFEIRALLVERRYRLNQLDTQIRDLQKVMDDLKQERDGVSSYVDAHEALISPVRRLPHDIIQEIFVACLPTHRNCVMSAVEAPVLLGRICTSWRSISLSTPRLWACLHIVEPSCFGLSPAAASLDAKLAQRLDVTKSWLSRSGNCPISISLEGPLYPWPSTEFPHLSTPTPKTHLFLEALIPFASRWRSMALSVWGPALNPLCDLTDNDVPILSKLDINQHTQHPVGPPWQSFPLFRAPALSDLRFAGFDSKISDFPVEWANLTSLSLIGLTGVKLSGEIALEILRRSPQLQACRLLLGRGTPADVVDNSVVELPLLHSLYINVTSNVSLDGIVARLSVPALRHFDVRGSRIGYTTSDPKIVAFLATSQVETIRIDAQMLSRHTSFADFLHGMPVTVQRLQIKDYTGQALSGASFSHFDDDALALLTPSPDGSVASCPGLRELRVTDCTYLSDKALLHFLNARMAVQPPTLLSLVEIQFNRDIQLDIESDIRPFLDRGLRVRTRYPRVTDLFSPWNGLVDAPKKQGATPWVDRFWMEESWAEEP